MLVEIICLACGIALATCGAIWFWPVCPDWWNFYRPIVLFVAGYLAGVAISWIFFDIAGRLTSSYKKTYDKPSKFARFMLTNGIAYITFHAMIRQKKTGLEKIPNEPFLLVSNHKSNFDPMLVSQALYKRDIAFITKKDNMKIPLGARFMWRLCYMPVNREDKLQSLEQFKKAADLISSGVSSVGIYPEGTRQKEGVILGEFHNGAFNIAIKTKCPIVIMTMRGTEKIHKRFPRITRIKMKCVQVLYYEEYSSMNATELCNYVHEIMYKELSDN